MTGQRVTKPGDRARVCWDANRFEPKAFIGPLTHTVREVLPDGRIKTNLWKYPIRSWIIVQEGGRK